MAQTFEAGVSSPLTQLDLYREVVNNASPVPLTVDIVPLVGGIPQAGSPMASATVTPTPGNAPWAGVGDPAWIPVTATTPANVVANTSYAIVLGWQLPSQDSAPPRTASWLMWQVDASWATYGYNGYTNDTRDEAVVGTHVGTAFNVYDVFQVPSINDSQTGNAHFAFRTYVTAAATPTPTVTQPPTDTVPAAGSKQTPSGWLPLLLAMAGVSAIFLLSTRRAGIRRR